MSDPNENSNMDSHNLSEWTLVSSRGEIMSGDEDSESSESSIEVVSLEGNEVVSHRLQRERSLELVTEIVREEVADSSSLEHSPNSEKDAHTDSANCSGPPSAGNNEEIVNHQGDFQHSDINNETNLKVVSLDSLQTSLTLSGSQTKEIPSLCGTDDVSREQAMNQPESGFTLQHATESHISFSCETTEMSGETKSGQVSHVERGQAVIDGHIMSYPGSDTETHENDSMDLPHTTEDSGIEKSQAEDIVEAKSSVFCMKILSMGEDAGQANSLSNDDATVNSEDPNISLDSVESVRSSSNRGDSDTDSDFVRLDSENIDAFVGEHENNEEKVIISLKLYHSNSSIGHSFNFMRTEDRNNEVQQETYIVGADQDHDEDTESSTEEAVDDRIESEQSETGSLSAQNDVGDLSVFADIGDLPLVAGDVPRNYIHRPNNHLSTVLNIIVVLVAMLTMGISLGIIMATDLEIEEWQNAHEFQTKRVNQLELQLHGRQKAYELQLNKIKELESQLADLRSTLWNSQQRAKNYDSALDSLAKFDISVEGENYGKFLQIVLDGIRTYVCCAEEFDETVDCQLKLHQYVKSYTSPTVKDYSFEETKCSFIGGDSLRKESYDDIDLHMQAKEIASDETSFTATPLEVKPKSQEKAAKITQEPDITSSEPVANSIEVKAGGNDAVSSQKESVTLYPNVAVLNKGSAPEAPSRNLDASSKKNVPQEFQALPIPLDIKQLQQSLTREQERALHWQQLYLSERRQKERERENEELEDEQERQMREKGQMDQVECLRKLMSANLTTLTRHVAKWNVSVFDDFANLSMLLSSVAELQHSVINSVQRVWESAEEVIESLQSKDSSGKDKPWENVVPKKEMIIKYLSQLVDQVKKVDMPDHRVLVQYIDSMLEHVKHGVERIMNEVYTEYVANSMYEMWENAEEIIRSFQIHEKANSDGEKASKEHLLKYLSKLLNDICHEKDTAAHTTLFSNVDGKAEEEDHNPDAEEVHFPEDLDYDSSQSGQHLNEEESNKHGFWSRRIGKILKKTGKTVRKIGRKVAGTWDKIKTMWRERKPLWHRIKTMWHEKSPVLFPTATQHFTFNFLKASSKFVKMCTKQPTQEDINSKCVQKLRKFWQKILIKDPCQVVGKFSYECNSGKDQCKRDLNKISDSFNLLLKIPNVKRDQILTMKTSDVKAIYNQFKTFHDKWEKSKLLLKTDIEWVNCQLLWWEKAVSASHSKNVDMLENKCNINLMDNFHEELYSFSFDPNTDNKDYEDKDEDDDEDENYSEDVYSHRKSTILNLADEGEKEEDVKDVGVDNHENSGKNNDGKNETDPDRVAHDWYLEQGRHRMELRREEGKADWVFEHAAYREHERVKQRRSDWVFEKAEDRKHHREQSDKTFWLFEREDHQGDNLHKKWMKDSRGSKYSDHRLYNHGAKKSGSWFMENAKERQKIREEEHKSDWLFERAADRKKDHDDRFHSKSKKYYPKKSEHEKQFRHAYGKVSMP